MIQKEDRRIQRSRQMIQNAFIELTVEKGYDKVTVQDIVDRANVGRATFYAHYQDKEDLLTQSIGSFFEYLIGELEQEKLGKEELVPTQAIFEHIEDHAHIHRAFSSTEVLHKKFHEQLVLLITDRLEVFAARGQQVAMPKEVCANYFAGALMALINWWLEERRSFSAREMAQMYQKMVQVSLMSR